jgi:hypothetical protein
MVKRQQGMAQWGTQHAAPGPVTGGDQDCRKIGMYVIMDPDYNNNFNIITKRDGSV